MFNMTLSRQVMALPEFKGKWLPVSTTEYSVTLEEVLKEKDKENKTPRHVTVMMSYLTEV